MPRAIPLLLVLRILVMVLLNFMAYNLLLLPSRPKITIEHK